MSRISRITAGFAAAMVLCMTIILSLPTGLTAFAEDTQDTGPQYRTISHASRSYTSIVGSDMAYYTNGQMFDFIGDYGGSWKQTTYSYNGFNTHFIVDGSKSTNVYIDGRQNYGGLNLKLEFVLARDGSLQILYHVTNNNSTTSTFSVGSHADVMIGSNDSATITPFSETTVEEKGEASGRVKGFRMNEATNSGAQFNFYARQYAGVTSVDSLWYGYWSNRESYVFTDKTDKSTLSGTDSGMTFSWQNRTIEPGKTQTYSVKFMIAELGSENNIAATGTISVIKIGDIQHSFKVYQLLTGVYDPVEDKNIYATPFHWGTGLASYETTTHQTYTADQQEVVPLPVLTEFVNSETNQEKIDLINRMTLGTPIKEGTSVNGSIAFPNLTRGYYLIRDVTTFRSDNDEQYEVKSRDLLVYLDSNGVTVEMKCAKPRFSKSVATDGTAGELWGEVADYSLADTFQFKLTATLPADENFEGYNHYQLVFHDTWSAGIDFVELTGVSFTRNMITTQLDAEAYTLTPATGGFTLTIGDIKAAVGQANWDFKDHRLDVEVIYKARLNQNAPVISAQVENALYAEAQYVSENTAYLEYTNDSKNVSSLSRTADDHVGVFSYKLLNTKYGNFAENGYQLNGATFTLYKDAQAEGNAIPMVYDETLGCYRVAMPGEEGNTLMTSGYGQGMAGKFDIAGVDAGIYVLVEENAPHGYEKIDPLEFKIVANPIENADGLSASNTLEVYDKGAVSEADDKADAYGALSSMDHSIIDTLSSEKQLPETGGIGTKIFYIVGTIMVVGAGIVLIVKKRAKHDDN